MENKFSDSCLNLSLRQKDHFISAFPGKIVFGKCTPTGYINKHYFEFQIFELYKLYLAIIDIIKNFSDDSTFEKHLILSKCNYNYFFSVEILNNNASESFQVANFGIEYNSEIIHEVTFLDNEFNTFLYTLEKIVPLSMCLSSIESFLFKTASKESAKVIYGFQEDENCMKFVKTFLSKNKEDINHMEMKSIDCLVTFLNYYSEIILIFHKLQSLINISDIEHGNIASVIHKE